MTDSKTTSGADNLDPQQLVDNFADISRRSQAMLQDWMKQNGNKPYSVSDPQVVGKAFVEMTQALMSNPSKLIEQQTQYWQNYAQLVQNTFGPYVHMHDAQPPAPRRDKRFKDETWAENAVFDFIRQSYLLTADSLQASAADVEGLDDKTAEKVRFYTRQFVDAMAPTNFAASNPQVLKATLDSGGENLVKGLQNLLDDLQRGDGNLRVKMTDPDAFELGVNVATTPGNVVFQNELMQLLQYKPTTETVHKRPLLIVPPWINKFYILDLQSKNSFIKWAVDQGLTVFVVSWVNPDEKLADTGFEDYMHKGPLAALDAIKQATGVSDVNAIGYCIGGTLLSATLSYMHTHKDKRIKSATFFTTLLDFTDVGELSVFVDDAQIELLEQHMEEKGYLEGSHMASAFNMLRANDLIWSFVVRNYLLGEEPMPFDLLYWNSDSTRMPRRMHSFYLRNMYQHNRLREPGGITLSDTPIDISQVDLPCYFLATHDDHIAPWTSSFAGSRILGKGRKTRFVLGGSGHIAGVINPPAAGKYGYRTNDADQDDPESWLEGAQQHEGSWWDDWYKWLKRRAGTQVDARAPGDGTLPVIEEAPGSYVKLRIE